MSADSALPLQAVAGAVRRELENALTRNSPAGYAYASNSPGVQPVPLTNQEGSMTAEPTPAVIDTAPAPDLPPVATNDPTPAQAAYGADQR